MNYKATLEAIIAINGRHLNHAQFIKGRMPTEKGQGYALGKTQVATETLRVIFRNAHGYERARFATQARRAIKNV